MQVNRNAYRHPIHAGSELVRLGGVRALYYGMPAFLTQTSGKAAIRFTAFEYFRTNIVKSFAAINIDATAYPSLVGLTAGLAAGTAEALIWTTPTERLKVLRQTEVGAGDKSRYGTILGGIRTVLNEQGIRGLYVGAIPTALRQASSVGIRFMSYDTVKHLFCRLGNKDPTDTTIALLSGGTVGAVSVIINNPIDVVKSSLQSKDSKYKGTMDCAVAIFKQNGPTGFFRGLSARVPRVFCGQAITFAVYERIIRILD